MSSLENALISARVIFGVTLNTSSAVLLKSFRFGKGLLASTLYRNVGVIYWR